MLCRSYQLSMLVLLGKMKGFAVSLTLLSTFLMILMKKSRKQVLIAWITRIKQFWNNLIRISIKRRMRRLCRLRGTGNMGLWNFGYWLHQVGFKLELFCHFNPFLGIVLMQHLNVLDASVRFWICGGLKMHQTVSRKKLWELWKKIWI